MPTLATSPALPVPDRQLRLTFTLTGLGTNYLRAWCTNAPQGSALQGRIESARLNRVLLYEGDAGNEHPLRATFDKGGVYTLKCQEYTKGNNWGGGYEGDPRGAPTETKVGSEGTVTLYVAQRMTQQLGFGQDQATLVLFVLNDTIQQTIAAVHGEASPAIVSPTSDRAATAAKTDLVTTALAALAGVTTTAAIGDLGSSVDNWITEFVDHSGDAAFHENADDQADLEEDYRGATSIGGITKALNKLRTRFGQHTLNSKENDPTHPEYQLPGGIDIHAQTTRLDLQNALLPVTADEGDQASLFAAGGDFFRAYEAHRVSNMHDTADNTNALPALTGLLALHRRFMASLASSVPAAQPGQSSGAAQLIVAGFTES